MNRNGLRISGFVFLVVIVGLFVAAVLVASAINTYPQLAEELYGPPSPHLSAFQRYRLSYTLVQHQDSLLVPLNPTGPQIQFTIEAGQSTAAILMGLEAGGLIADSAAVRDYLVYSGLDTQLQAGEFTLSPAMTPVQVVQALLDATPRTVTVSVLPGWRLEELALSLPTTGLSISSEEFIEAAYAHPNGFTILKDVPAGVPLEGFFLPGSYELPRETTAGQLVDALLSGFDEQVGRDLREGFTRQGLTLYQAVILASIVERETVVEEEMPVIASVFYNRLALGMKLETDPTIQYALGYNQSQATWWTSPLSFADLEVDSPYNTYRYPGLPPTPIANPSLGALQAVAFPAETPYYYFRAACDNSGRHNFAQTFEEHLANACP